MNNKQRLIVRTNIQAGEETIPTTDPFGMSVLNDWLEENGFELKGLPEPPGPAGPPIPAGEPGAVTFPSS